MPYRELARRRAHGALQCAARGARPAALVVLVGVVVWVHGCVGQTLAAFSLSGDAPERMRANYVQTLAVSALPPLRAVAVAGARPARAARSQAATPQPEVPLKAPATPPPEPDPERVEPVPPPNVAASMPLDAASGPASAAAQAASAPGEPGFQWPRALRMGYALTGYYKGEIYGGAQVEWVSEGLRYQVHLDSWVGLKAAPFMSRSISSQGELTERGLRPSRYDQSTSYGWKEPVRHTVQLEPGHVQLSDGTRRPRWPDMQDTASQFIQLSWYFSHFPELLEPGAQLIVPLAQPRNVARHVYEVTGLERLATPLGELAVWHVVPRTPPRGGDLSIELWLAPQLRYLPVRIRLRQSDETFVDLLIAQAPEVVEANTVDAP